jgi:small subunit ribosomal protein S6
LRRYETIFITHPEISEEDHALLEEKLHSIVASLKGDFLKLEDWGPRRLSYEIRKNSRGRFFLMDYLATPELVRELERNLRLNDRVFKFQTVRVSDQVSPDAAKTLKESAPAEKIIKVGERPPAPEEQKKPEQEKVETEGGEGR